MMGDVLAFILRLIVGVVTVCSVIFLWSAVVVTVRPALRRVTREASQDQKRSVAFLTTWFAGFLSTVFGIPNGIFIGLVPYQFFSTITSSLIVAALATLVSGIIWSLFLVLMKDRKPSSKPVRSFLRGFLSYFCYNAAAVFLIRSIFIPSSGQ